MLVRSSLVSTFKRCCALAYYQYVLGLTPDVEGKSQDLAFGSLVHDASDMFNKTGDVKDSFSYIEGYELPFDKRKNKAVAKALIRSYAKQFAGTVFTESESSMLLGQDLTFPIGRHFWRLRLDGVAIYQGKTWLTENKTTQNNYLLTRPNDQFLSYYIAAKRIDPSISGIMLTHFDVDTVRVTRSYITPTKDEIDEWLIETEFFIDYMEHCAWEGIFPTNPMACLQFGYRKPCYCLPLCQARSHEERHYLIHKYYKVNNEAIDLSW